MTRLYLLITSSLAICILTLQASTLAVTTSGRTAHTLAATTYGHTAYPSAAKRPASLHLNINILNKSILDYA